MDLVHELCPLHLLEVTKKSDTWAGWLASIQHLAHIHIYVVIYLHLQLYKIFAFHETIFPSLLKPAPTPIPTFYIIIFHLMHSESSMIIYESGDAKQKHSCMHNSVASHSTWCSECKLYEERCWSYWTLSVGSGHIYSANWTLSIDL